ncbi:MAG: GNAT family N-acetyltransferase [Acidimicrobiales bacterium]
MRHTENVVEVRVRQPEPGDASAVARVHIQAWKVGYHDLLPAKFLAGLNEEAGAARWAQRLSETKTGNGEPGVEFLVAERRDEAHQLFDLAGIATIGPVRSSPRETVPTTTIAGIPDGELWMINVRPDAWSSGVGTALLTSAVERLVDRGSTSPVLWVLRDNDRARRFYEANGWVADGVTKTDEIGGEMVDEVRYRYRGADTPQA